MPFVNYLSGEEAGLRRYMRAFYHERNRYAIEDGNTDTVINRLLWRGQRWHHRHRLQMRGRQEMYKRIRRVSQASRFYRYRQPDPFTATIQPAEISARVNMHLGRIRTHIWNLDQAVRDSNDALAGFVAALMDYGEPDA